MRQGRTNIHKFYYSSVATSVLPDTTTVLPVRLGIWVREFTGMVVLPGITTFKGPETKVVLPRPGRGREVWLGTTRGRGPVTEETGGEADGEAVIG